MVGRTEFGWREEDDGEGVRVSRYSGDGRQKTDDRDTGSNEGRETSGCTEPGKEPGRN